MGSLFRDLNATACSFCSTKNELLVVMVLSNQTLGFGKISDPLTDKRLAQLTGIRLDRLRPAVNAVIKKGLFDRKPHKRFGHEYSIGKVFLEEYKHNNVYTPNISQNQSVSEKQNPIFGKNRHLTQMGKDLTEKRTHTETNILSSQPQQQTNTKTKFNSIQPPQTQTVPLAEQQSVKLFFSDESQIPQNFAIETSSANTRIEFSFEKNIPQINTTKSPVEPIKIPATTTPKTTAKLKKMINAVKKEPISSVEKTPVIMPKPAACPTKNREPWMDDALEAADYLDRQHRTTRSKREATTRTID